MAYQIHEDDIYDKNFKQDCVGYDLIPTIIEPVKRVVAIGDMHGDLDLFIETLKLAKVIDNNNHWKEKLSDTIVVILGDILDSCRPMTMDKNSCQHKSSDKNDIALDTYINQLKSEAIRNKSDVIALIGNHEIRNVMGIMDYVSKKSVDEFKNMEERIDQYKPGNSMALRMGCTRTGVVVIGSNIFVHGGIILSLLQKFGMDKSSNKKEVLQKINLLLRKWLLGKIELQLDAVKNVEKFIQLKTSNISDKDLLQKLGLDKLTPKDLLTLLNDTKTSPFWYRAYGMLNEKNPNKPVCQNLVKTLESLELDNMLIAHSPQNFIHHLGMNRFVCHGERPYISKMIKEQGINKSVVRLDIGNAHAFEPYNYTKICLNQKCINVNQSTVISKMNKMYSIKKPLDQISIYKNIQVVEIINDKTFNVLTKEIEVKTPKFIETQND